ncbi:nSTAND1 domain-containing NTPase [Oxynema aestuarii]|uniref:Peptidase C14 caspase domain-containing protein n=1 Tax=Oxynema aestuarii AP17 TaxID=2064643 RepID=A0A6H1U228_9CYAN|nr:caspase family protein [Oxynema aestuarii]QIZ72928.1 hypothetical protein HCG48_21920 [Oxynema aestuarii AP17]
MKRALVVGINNYRHLKNLRTPANDANALARRLREIGFDDIRGLPVVSTLEAWQVDAGEDAEKPKQLCHDELERAIDWLFAIDDNSNIPETALLFFAGHGLRQVKGRFTQGFLATSRANPENNSTEKWGVSLSYLRQVLEHSPVKQQIAILDCCHSGELFNYKEADPGQSERVTRCLISACGAPELAYESTTAEHSVFAEALLQGLQQEGVVSTVTLSHYLIQALEPCGQTPKAINRDGEIILIDPDKEPLREREKAVVTGKNPYKGLAAFQKEDAPYFFGRQKLTKTLVNRIHDDSFLAVLGISGSGKSSVVRAGLIPELEKGDRFPDTQSWKIYDPFKPGDDPLESLARVLVDERHSLEQVNAELAQGAEGLQRLIAETEAPAVVLVVDQFEQIFTQRQSHAKRQQFLDCLLGALNHCRGDSRIAPTPGAIQTRHTPHIDSDPPLSKGGRGGYSPSLRVVITMRADFVGECAEYPQLAQLIETNNKIVGQMQEAELREAIAKPAEKEGWTIPEDLQNEIVKDVQQSPGSLPLLQYLLYELWDWRDRGLKVKTYQDMGGVLGTLQTQADKVYNSLDPEEQTVAKSIFLELTQLVEEDKPTCRQVRKTRLTDLPPSPEKVETVLAKLEDARLIVTGELQARGNNGDKIKVVDVAHEALIRNWNTLKQWLGENRQIKRQRDELKDKAQDWENKGKRREGLLRGIDLSDAEAFVRRYGETGIALEYVQKSIRQQRITHILSIGTVATVLTVVTGLWLNAQRQATIANLRAKAAQAQQLLTTSQPLGGLVLAIQATGESQDQLGRVMSSVQSSLRASIQTPGEQNRFQGHQDWVVAVAFSPDGETVVSGSADNTLRLWTRQGEPIGEPWRGHQNSVVAVAFSPDGETVVSGSADNTLRLWTRQGEPIGEPWRGHQNSVWAVAFSPDGETVVSGSADNTLRLWTRQGEPIGEPWRGHQNWVVAVAFSPDGETVVSGSADNTLRLWTRQGEPIGEPWRGHQNWVVAVAFSPDGETVVSGSRDGTLRLWTRQGEPIGEPWRGHQNSVGAVAFSPDGETVVSGSADNTLRLWTRQGEPIGEPWRGHQDWVWAVAFSPDGETVVSGSADNTLRLWTRQGEPIGEPWRGHQNSVWAVAFSPDGETVVSGSADNTLRLWTRQGEPIGEPWRGHQNSVVAVAFSPDGETVVSGSRDGTLRLWTRQGEPIGEPWRGHQNSVWAVAFSPDGETVVSGSADNTVRLWTRQGEPIGEPWRGHQNWVGAVAFSPDGETVVSGSRDGTLRLWTRQGEPIGEPWRGHQNWVGAVAFSPDGETVVSGSRDGTLRLWTRQGEPIGEPWRGHQNSVWAVAFSPDGETVVSGSADNTLRLWHAGDWKIWLQMACNQLQYHPVLVHPQTDIARDAGKTCQKYAWSPTESADFLVRHGKAIARDGDFSGAVTQFNRALKLDDSLDLDPESEARELAVPALIAQGEELAREAQVEEARAKFQQAVKLDETLDLDPEAEAIEIATSTLVKQGEQLAGEGQVDEAVAKFQQAVTVDETLDLDPEAKATELGVPVLVAQGKELAGEGKVDEAAEKFQAALKWDETLKLDPKSEATQIAASALVEQGKQLAREGRVDAAIEKFQQALKLDDSLDLDPEADARQLAAAAWVDKAKQFAADRKYKAAIEAYTEAEKLDPNLEISARTWNNLCWYGSLRGEAEAALAACENAVQLAPNDANPRGNLGIAKALTGDTEGAIQAFENFIELSENEGVQEVVQGYIDTLRAGENPFTEEEIKRLLGE